MLNSTTSLQASKASRYLTSLGKHFAQKVTVEWESDAARVLFPMGICIMKAEGETLHFNCEAETTEALQKVQSIIDSHVVNFREWKQVTVSWRDSSSN